MNGSTGAENSDISKKPGQLHNLITAIIIGLILLIAVLIIFFSPNLSGISGTYTRGSSQGGGTGLGSAGIPPAVLMPTAEITTQSVTCQVSGQLDITGKVQNNVNRPLSVEIAAAGYDNDGAVRGTGYDTVTVDSHRIGTFTIAITDGCMLGETGTYDVRIVDISWRHSS